MGLQAPELQRMRIVPPRARLPLRHLVLLVPHAEQGMVFGDLLSPLGAWRRTLIPQLLVCLLPPERVFVVQLYRMSRTWRPG